MNAFLSSAHCLRYFLGFALSILFFGSVTFALPLGAMCETQNCDSGLICKNNNGETVPPGSGPGTCVANCNNNNFCDAGETVQYCPNDCHCGNGVCEPAAPWSENSANCAQDCFCGNGTVEVGENNCTCPADVPATTCGDGCCVGGENSSNCSQDCGLPPLCGNGNIDPGETFCNCPADVQDATCGDGCCSIPEGETVSSCYQDCGFCGDGICTAPETVGSCPSDCHTCGDGICSAPRETANNCVDCQVPSCTISGPSVCRNNTYTFDCNYYYVTGTISMSNSNPNQTTQGDSITVSFGPSAQGVTTLACFNNATQLCTTSRSIGFCGDGTTNCGEQCDYGNSFPNACNPTTCEREPCTNTSDCGVGGFVCIGGFCDVGYCGDGEVSQWEQCEQNSDCAGYGNGYTCDYCSCVPPVGGGNPVCGNLIVELGEQCDDGDPAHPGQGGTTIGMDTCDGATCTNVNVCGDGVIGPGEECDDGGRCTAWGGVPPLSTDPYCNEESDCNYASNRVCAPRGGDGCSATCQIEPGWVCGDGIVAGNEQCDDGNSINGDGCDNNCTFTACGNGIVTGTEECDDGNTINDDGCSNTCQGAFCGDGILQENGADGIPGTPDDEVCDDGNTVNGDGCSADCSYCGLHCPDCSVKLPNLDVFFVVDTSASMAEPVAHMGCGDGDCKLIDAKTAIELFVNALNPAEDRVALIDFNSTATVRYGLASNTGFSEMLTAVNTLQATGLTNMGDALEVLHELANTYTYIGRTPVVIFLGDGQPTLPSPTPDPVGFTEIQAADFHTAFPAFKVFSIGLDLTSPPMSPTNLAAAIDLLQNHIASTPADYYQGAPGGRGAMCGGSVGSKAGNLFGGGGTLISFTEGSFVPIAGGGGVSGDGGRSDSGKVSGGGLAETYGQIRNQMCQCGLTPPTPVCADAVKQGGQSMGGAPKAGFCAGNPKLSCTTNANCGLQGPCITSNNLCGGREWYSCEGGATCEGCGDGIVQAGEQCDLGIDNGLPGKGCDKFCKLTSYCGDGIVQDCEACDDGNYEAGDGCSPWCTKETVVCGDDVINLCGVLTGTYLADGNEDGYCAGDASIYCNAKGVNCPAGKGPCLEATYCNLGETGNCLHDPSQSCTSNFDCTDEKTGVSVCVGLALAQIPDPSVGGPKDVKLICGNDIEFCDDGNQVDGDGCPANCQSTCGDGIVEGNEQCDDGNQINTDACTNACRHAICGDGIVRTGIEQCDDWKNGDDTDGCTDQCTTGPCDPTTQYASGQIPGWSCPEDWVLQGCPGAYLCVKKTIAPVICTECGDGVKGPTEECDWSDPTDPHREACNQFCLLNYCGDGEVFTGAFTGFVRNWNSSGATSTRPTLAFSRVITQGQGGMSTILETGAASGSLLGTDMAPLNDIDGDGITEIAVSAPGHDVGGQAQHGQIFSLSFDTGGKVDAVRPYFSGLTLTGGNLAGNMFTTIADIDNSIFGPGSFPVHHEFVFSAWYAGMSDRLLSLFIGKHSAYVGANSGYVQMSPTLLPAVTEVTTVGDIDGNGVQDIAVAYYEGTEVRIAVILLTGSPAMRLSMQVVTGLGFSTAELVRMSPMGDTDGDGIPDIMISAYNATTGLMTIKRLTLQSNGALKNQSTIYTVTLPGANYAFAIYGEDIDEDGVKDIVTFRSKEAPYVLDGLLLLLNANRTVKASHLLDFGAYKAPGDLFYYPHSALFGPDMDGDNDETVLIGSPRSFSYKGAIYAYELQPPYGHELTGGIIEECDAGSYCDDLVTRCEDNPAICPGGPSRCQPRYINGCTPFCQLGCGDGVVDANGLDGLPNTDDDEECDDGNGINTDGCTNECKRPFCGDTILTLNSDRTGNNGERPNGYFEQCDPTSTGQNYGNCQNDCTLTGSINALCNFSFASSVAYNAETVEELLEAVEAENESLCFPRVANVLQSLTGLVDPNTGIMTGRSRTCQGQQSGQSAQCVLPRWACGDGILDEWSGTEECDDGNTVDGDGCSAECQWEDPLIAPLNQCTVGSYPQVEVGEYLPVWWVGERSESVGPVGGTCDINTTTNMILRNTIMCQVNVQRGDPVSGKVTVATVSVPCATQATAGVGLISGAIADFAPGISMNETLGTYLFNSGQVNSWVNYGSNPLYGQYQMAVEGMNMNYCALRRTSAQGTVTGDVTEFSNFEDCTNNVDDNGDGLIDCADPLCGNFAVHPHCDPNWIGGGGGACVTNADCTPDQFICNGTENFCDAGTCVANPSNDPVIPYDACMGIVPGVMMCDDNSELLAMCRKSQREALGMMVTCYEKLINYNAIAFAAGNQQCPTLSFTGGNCQMVGCEQMPVAPGPGINRVGPVYTPMVPPPILTQPANFESFATQLRHETMLMHGSVLQSLLLNQLPSQFPGLTGISLHPEHLAWLNYWQSEQEGIIVPMPLYIPSGGSGEVEICDDGIDQNNDGIMDCSAGNCHQSANCMVGWNEDCFDVDSTGNPIDNNNNGLANEFDPDCYQFHGTGYQAPQPIGNRTIGPVITYASTGAMCEAGFSVSKGYFVQQGFTFSEQANTGLDTASFTNIAGISLVAEGTAIDDSLNQVATYQGAGKRYLFDDFIDTWITKAVNPILPNGSIDTSVKFLKVPTAHIYFWDGAANILTLDTALRNRILAAGGVQPSAYDTTAYTIVLPEVANNLVLQGTIRGNGMYISQGNIRFSSSADLGCDGSDVVEGLFVAGGSFETDTIGNRSLNQDTWCKGGNLQIKGTLLGMNAGSQLAPLRRSVLNAWSSGNLLFDESKVFQAKELFETCYLPALLSTKANSISTLFTKYTSPISGCSSSTLWSATRESVIASAKIIGDTFLNNLTSLILQQGLSCIGNCSVPRNNFILSMLDQGVSGSGTLLVPSTLTIKRPNGSITTISVQQNEDAEGTLLYQMQQQNKLFPIWWFQGGRYNTTSKAVTIDLTNPVDKKEMIEDLSRVVGDIRQQFLSFPSREMQSIVFNDIGATADVSYTTPSTLVGKLYNVFVGGFLTYINNLPANRCEGELLKTVGGAPKGGSFNKFICSPDMVWLRSNRNSFLDESVSRGDSIIEGSSVVILSNPTTWTDLPPGAKDFLNSLVVLPK